MAITELRPHYKPFEYQIAFEFFKDQHRGHWLADEVPLSSDLNDWRLNLNESEKNLIGNILKSFAQTEVHVNDYWSSKISQWFPKPEVVAMASSFGAFEAIHAEAYARLNDELGLDNFQAFMEDEASRNKIERLLETPSETIEEKALALAIFSAFILYSSFYFFSISSLSFCYSNFYFYIFSYFNFFCSCIFYFIISFFLASTFSLNILCFSSCNYFCYSYF